MPELINLNGEKVKNIRAPQIFNSPVRKDLINRAFWIMFTHHLQKHGRDPRAGEKTSAQSWQTGHGVARVARVKGEKNPRSGQAAGVASVRKGRLTHPPRSEKVIYKRLNKKERRLALLSAISASAKLGDVITRGHRIANNTKLPIIVIDEIQRLQKTKDMIGFLEKIGLSGEMNRVIKRAKDGNSKHVNGPLFVIAKDEGIRKAISNIEGLSVVHAKKVSVLDLAPGGNAGRLTIWSESAVKVISKRLSEVIKVEA